MEKGGLLLFGIKGVLGQLYIGYGTLIETLFRIGQMIFLVKKKVINHTYAKKNVIMFQSLMLGSSITINSKKP